MFVFYNDSNYVGEFTDLFRIMNMTKYGDDAAMAWDRDGVSDEIATCIADEMIRIQNCEVVIRNGPFPYTLRVFIRDSDHNKALREIPHKHTITLPIAVFHNILSKWIFFKDYEQYLIDAYTGRIKSVLR